MVTDVLGDGRVRIRDGTTAREIAVVADDAAAKAFIAESGPDLAMGPQLDASSPVPTNAGLASAGGTAQPPPPQGQVTFAPDPNRSRFQEFVDRMNSMFSVFTSMEATARSFEKRGFGPAFNRVYEPIQKAWRQIDLEIARTPRAALGGKTFQEYFRGVEKELLRGMGKEERENVVRYMEALSRQEIEKAGGFMQRAMTKEEIDFAREIVNMGLGREMPRLIGLNSTIRNYLKNQKEFLRKAQQQLKDPDVSDEHKQVIMRLIGESERMKSPMDVMNFLNLSAEEVRALGIIEHTFGRSKDKVSIYAISRWAGAEDLKPGFTTMRQQFAKEKGLNAKQLEAARRLDVAYKHMFELSGLDAKRELSGYWPHMRELSKWGFDPASEFIKRVVPESTRWSALRYRSGELNVYSLDPASTSFRYLRSLFMNQHLDPILPDVKAGVRQVSAMDERAGRIMREYVLEATGHPHETFERLSSAMRAMFPGAPHDVGEKLINTMVATAYGATIPFRAMLILRNAYQMVQTIPGRVGWGDFYDGLRVALSKDGFDYAVKHGAVPANVKPIFEATQILEPGKTFMPQRFRDIMDVGFDWYRYPDDIGRAAAFHAQRARIARHEAALQKGQITYGEFKKKAKVLTYDQLDIQRFDELWANGQYDEAKNILGRSFAFETHFRYGHANHPAGWGSVYGRLFGQFGTWPVQYKDFVVQGLSRGTTKDKLEFVAGQAIANGGIVAAGAAVGMNLENWVVFPSLAYTGGPYAGMAVDLVQAISGGPQEKQLARRSLGFAFPSLEDPRSIFIPGSYAVGDLVRAFREPSNAAELGIKAMGGRFYEEPITPVQAIEDYFFDF